MYHHRDTTTNNIPLAVQPALCGSVVTIDASTALVVKVHAFQRVLPSEDPLDNGQRGNEVYHLARNLGHPVFDCGVLVLTAQQ